ncbi:UvrD-helicase domain-containing protein [Pseudohaliea rubra]|uniref:ATP-dependent DNA helicase Rep n=1 Tax=Pseudohaliea rubra DSM 19751 TaxID=1265313 RepID=A0A095VW14_9GAMM|nr:UvrD-helicase domain-containing protein [Pseudohaliea rubra]KGE05238.1 ATP-dependent DNA helicase Rep [Pseudohaliea rubra DSM 19751]
MNDLNPPQRDAVRYIDGPLLVLAGAGSGKTSVITRKVAYLVRECGLRPDRVAAVTFTNKAAREMRERLGRLLPREQAEGLAISTFHQLGLRILRAELGKAGLRRGFSIMDNLDSLALLRDLLAGEQARAADPAPVIMQRISQWKNAGLAPAAAASAAEDATALLAARAYERYDEALRTFNAVDFDDLLCLPTALLGRCPETRQRWQEQVHYLLVDEYQDTNEAQYLLVRQLVDPRGALTAVGDDDQSIYAWRGARPENLGQLGQDFPALRVIKLEQNYRSRTRILHAANTLIANNPHLHEKSLWSDLGPGEPLRVMQCADEDAEAEQVVAEIVDHNLRKRTRWGNYAILYRSNHQARLLELVLQRQQVPYQLSGGTSFFARNEIKDVMAYLRLLINPDDDNAFLRAANTPRRGLGATTLAALGQAATAGGTSLARACDGAAVPTATAERLRQFTALLARTRRAARESGGTDALRDLLREIRYEDWLLKQSSDETVAERRMRNVWFLVESLGSLMRRENCSLEDAVAQLLLRDLMEQQEEERASESSVQLMTLHAAKGLEFPHVFLIGMEEGLLPHRNSLDDGAIEEERRLAYVGITRARETLTLTWARQRRQYGEKIDSTPSRFLDELPQDDLERIGGTEADKEKNSERGQETLASLQALFD